MPYTLCGFGVRLSPVPASLSLRAAPGVRAPAPARAICAVGQPREFYDGLAHDYDALFDDW